MLRNYWKIAVRQLLKHKAFSLINLLGLSVGVACCLLLLLFIQHERSYDRFQEHGASLYRVNTLFTSADGVSHRMATTSPPIVMKMREELPEVANATRLVYPPGTPEHLLRHGDKMFLEQGGVLVDSTFFQLFTYQFLAGDPYTCLREPRSLVLTETIARKLFGDDLGLHQVVSVSDNGGAYDMQVTGIVAEPTQPTHLEARFFMSMNSTGLGEWITGMDEWAGQNFIHAYLTLQPGTTPEALEAKLPAFLNRHGADDFARAAIQKSLYLQPVHDIHLYSDFGGSSARIGYVYIMAAIAAFLLLIACINFMNLSTARAAQRASEVGIRKTMGAERGTLIRQFMGESLLLVGLAVVTGCLLADLLLPYFNHLTGQTLRLSVDAWLTYLLMLGGVLLVTGLLAGSYPALFLSSFNPIQVLKGRMHTSLSAGQLRRILVVFQFVVAIVLMAGVGIIFQQLHYIRQKNLGFASEARLVIPLRTHDASTHYPALREKLLHQTGVANVTGAVYVPGQLVLMDWRLYREGHSMEQAERVTYNEVDYEYLALMDIPLLAGRNFDRSRPTDSTELHIIVNEATLAAFGIPLDQAVGEHLKTDLAEGTESLEIIGVIRDYHQYSLHNAIDPLMLHLPSRRAFDQTVVALNTADVPQTLAALETAWKALNPDLPFEYSFLDENLGRLYEQDQRMGQIIGSFAGVAILISCLGLYGLSAYVAERRTKEIGVRKVLGANVQHLVVLLSKEFTILVLIAFVIATPLAWYALAQWLAGFAYPITLGPGIFLLAGLTALAIAWFTISYQSLRAALSNPVRSLRSE
ncbi:putative ABC transport system permease protein [Catalinimonas alkaloidigena]|uniref:Putative ABC transport system permease protein n=1 Tax=Catalinimonas alkaloidigena TaxID=1075417 RepID=A0A1G9UGB2_9BACT|nr:FtsX-like permease family protein [Catalinimonas alkaloidigena]SDM58936.1 putative ABC transport system permease protein [Catalinimonas alkaloidigena]